VRSLCKRSWRGSPSPGEHVEEGVMCYGLMCSVYLYKRVLKVLGVESITNPDNAERSQNTNYYIYYLALYGSQNTSDHGSNPNETAYCGKKYISYSIIQIIIQLCQLNIKHRFCSPNIQSTWCLCLEFIDIIFFFDVRKK
jgi:hypothetical protein